MSTDTTAFFEAVRAGDAATVQRLLDEDPGRATARHESGVSAVLFACYNRHPDVAERIAAVKGELDVSEAAALDRAEDLRRMLDADPKLADARGGDGYPVLSLATYFGADEAFRVLLGAGADPDQAAPGSNRTALHGAAAARRTDLVQALLLAGADPNLAQQGGWTPLHQAAAHGDTEMARALLAAGADPRAKAEDGRTPAEKAEAEGHTELAKLIRRSPV